MQKIETSSIENLLANNEKTWMNAENAYLRANEKIHRQSDSLYIGDNFIRISRLPELFKEMGWKIKISADDIPDDLVNHITEYLLKKSGGLEIATLDKEIVSFAHKKFPYTLNQLCEKLYFITESNIITIQSKIDHNSVTIYSIDQVINKEPRKDDVVCGGLAVRATITGSIDLYPFSFRMWCSNGAIHKIDDANTRWSFQFNGKGLEYSKKWFDDVKQKYAATADSTLERIVSLTNKTIETQHVSGLLLQMVEKQQRLTKREIDRLTRDINPERPINAYDFWNNITERLTSLAHDDPERGLRYFQFGGAIGDFIGGGRGLVHCNSCGASLGSIELLKY